MMKRFSFVTKLNTQFFNFGVVKKKLFYAI